MRKLLFLSIAVAFSASAIAQNTHVLRPRVDVKSMSKMSADPNLVQNQNLIPRATAKRVLPSGNHVAFNTATVVPLSTAANAFGNFYIGKTRIGYDKNINTVTVFHRNDPTVTGDPNTGYYRYDKSTDGGATWAIDQGPVWGAAYNSTNTVTGRYPVGTVGNPVGNTDPNAGYEVYTGVWHTGSGSPANTWHGICWGTGKFDNATVTEHYETTNAAGNMAWVEDIFVTKGNTAYRMNTMELDNQGAYQDTLRVDKGVWNGTDYDYTSIGLHFPVNSGLGVRPYDMNVAFSDDGMTGYAVAINNADEGNTVYTTGEMYMQMYITHDGGNTWIGNTCQGGDPTLPLSLDVTFAPDGVTLSPLGAAWFGNPDSTFGVQGWGAARPDFDMAVDGSGNLHILVGVFPEYSFGETMSDPGTWGFADLYTIDGGANWMGQLVGKPNTFMGNLGDATNVTETNRPFVTRSWDGTKMFFGWFDTSPAFSVPTNDFPDMYVTGWDLTSNMWTPVLNLTAGGIAEGSCGFGNGAYYAMDDGAGTYEIPAFYMTMTSDANGVCQNNYLDDAKISASDFTVTAPAPIPLHSCTVGINEHTNNSAFSVSANYPNPFNGSTTVKVNLPTSVDVTIEVSNMVGQMISSKVYTNLVAGENKLIIDGSSLAKGMYTYKVIAGKDIATKTMMVR